MIAVLRQVKNKDDKGTLGTLSNFVTNEYKLKRNLMNRAKDYAMYHNSPIKIEFHSSMDTFCKDPDELWYYDPKTYKLEKLPNNF